MTTSPFPFARPRPGTQPPDLYPAYASTVKAGSPGLYRFDIVLQGDNETAFLDI